MIKEQGNFVRECAENYGGYGDRGNHNRTDRTLGILGTVFGSAALLALWNRNGNGGGSSSGVPTNVNINGGIGGGGCVAPTTFEVYKHECDDVLSLTNTLWGQKVNTLELLSAQRNTDVSEKFGLYQSQITADFNLYKDNRDNIDRVNNRINAELFDQYKYTRDKDDEIRAELSALKAEVAKNSAIRPYQDELIMCKIKEAFGNAINYTDKKTCRKIDGRLVLPTTPEVTGIAGWDCCGSNIAAAGA